MNPESQSPLVASLERGVSVRMKIKVGLRTDGSDLDLPIFVVKGRHPGPVLWIQGCLHGDEYAGSRAIHHFINKINPEKLCGAIIAVPVVNILAWEQKRRVSYVDNLDLNRVFPGSAEKTWTHFLAFHLLETISQNAHYVIDLHGYRSSYFALCFRQEDEPGAFALELALASGSPVVVNVSETWLEHSLFAVLTRRGIPAIIIEAPGEGRSDWEIIDYYLRCLRNISIKLRLLEGEPISNAQAIRISNLISIPAPGSGFVDLNVSRGDTVNKDDLLARILSICGDPIAEVRSPVDIALVLNLDTHGVIHRGEPLAMIGEYAT